MEHSEKMGILESYRPTLLEVEFLAEQVQRAASKAEKITVSYSLTPKGMRDGCSPMAGAVERKMLLEDKLRQKRDNVQAIDEAINGLQDAYERLVLQHRYTGLEKKTLHQICKVVNYSETKVRAIHNAAIVNLQLG